MNDVIKAGPEPQAILTPLTEAAIFLVLTVDRGSEEEVRDLLADVSGLTRSVGFRIPDGGLTCVVGLGSQLWDRLFGNPRPAGLHPFRELAGPKHTAVAHPATCCSTSGPTASTCASSWRSGCSSGSRGMARWSTRCTGSSPSTNATSSASWTAPRTRPARPRLPRS